MLSYNDSLFGFDTVIAHYCDSSIPLDKMCLYARDYAVLC